MCIGYHDNSQATPPYLLTHAHKVVRVQQRSIELSIEKPERKKETQTCLKELTDCACGTPPKS